MICIHTNDNANKPFYIMNPNCVVIKSKFSGYLLTVTARDGGVPSLSDTTDVEISVVDVNDNEPVFKQQLYTASIIEDALVGKTELSEVL